VHHWVMPDEHGDASSEVLTAEVVMSAALPQRSSSPATRVPSGISTRSAQSVDAFIPRRRQADGEQPRFILCRECFEPLELDPDRIQRLAGRTFIECGSCRQLIWIRRRDGKHAIPIGVLEGAQPTDDGEDAEQGYTRQRRRSDTDAATA
jgi:Probable zinc-ribbon domain